MFGEKNDPNTVVATGILETGKPVVGAGNKGIKTIDLGTKRILYTGSDSQLKGFNYGTANKVIGTDSSGNLVLKDMPTGKTEIILTISSVSSNAGISMGTPTNIDGMYCSNFSVSSYSSPTITITLGNSLILSASKSVRISLAAIIGSTAGYGSPVVSGIAIGKSTDTYSSATKLYSADSGFTAGGLYNKEITLAAGTYNKVFVDISSISSGSYRLKFGGLIVH